MKNFDLVLNTKAVERREDISSFSVEEAAKARKFHSTFPVYQTTPLVSLEKLAEKLSVKGIYLKDESWRFGLNAFKVLGASYAIANEIGRRIGKDITETGGSLLTGVLEMSNVDLANEFTQMITTQRGFQANSRIITTSDSLLEELVNLKR